MSDVWGGAEAGGGAMSDGLMSGAGRPSTVSSNTSRVMVTCGPTVNRQTPVKILSCSNFVGRR